MEFSIGPTTTVAIVSGIALIISGVAIYKLSHKAFREDKDPESMEGYVIGVFMVAIVVGVPALLSWFFSIHSIVSKML